LFREGRHLLVDTRRQGKETAGYLCHGCRSTVLYVHPGCAGCEIRACAEKRGWLHCGLCTEYPCERLVAFQRDGRPHHRDVMVQLEELVAKGPDQWLGEQARRWQCACGARFSWYEVACAACGAPLPSYGPDPRSD
jgi:hypothetical protein